MLTRPNVRRIRLLDILRRRRTNLDKWTKELGIQTYQMLVATCGKMGLIEPTEDEWNKFVAEREPVNVPTEGIVVVDVDCTNVSVISERTGDVVAPRPTKKKRQVDILRREEESAQRTSEDPEST